MKEANRGARGKAAEFAKLIKFIRRISIRDKIKRTSDFPQHGGRSWINGNYVIAELLRHCAYGKNNVNLNFYRDSKIKEIDLIIEENGILHPVEIRKSASPDRSAIKAFSVLKDAGREVGTGAVICMTDRVLPYDEDNLMMPSGII